MPRPEKKKTKRENINLLVEGAFKMTDTTETKIETDTDWDGVIKKIYDEADSAGKKWIVELTKFILEVIKRTRTEARAETLEEVGFKPLKWTDGYRNWKLTCNGFLIGEICVASNSREKDGFDIYEAFSHLSRTSDNFLWTRENPEREKEELAKAKKFVEKICADDLAALRKGGKENE